MEAVKIRRNTMIHINGRSVRVRDITRDGNKIKLHFDGGFISRKPGASILALAEMPAGPVKSQPYVRTPHTVRFSDSAWPGERDGTTQERIISMSRGWDL